MLIFSLSLFVSCKNELAEMTRANELLGKEKKVEALKIYEDVINRYPDTKDAETANSKMEKIYNEAAKNAEKENFRQALKLTKIQLKRWPRGLYAAEAVNRKAGLEEAIKQEKISLEEDRALCEKTKKLRTIKAWQEYLDAFPSGICHEEGEKKIKLRPANEAEIASFKEILPRCTEVASDCKRLATRYDTLKEKNELKYLQSTFYDYLSIRMEQFELAKQEGVRFVEGLYSNDVDTVELMAELNQNCSGCSENMLHLRELQACKEALASEGDEATTLWKAYIKDFPAGSCQGLAKTKLP